MLGMQRSIHDVAGTQSVVSAIYNQLPGLDANPHLFRHQFIAYLTKQDIISPKLQLLIEHATEQSLAVYRKLALSDVAEAPPPAPPGHLALWDCSRWRGMGDVDVPEALESLCEDAPGKPMKGSTPPQSSAHFDPRLSF